MHVLLMWCELNKIYVYISNSGESQTNIAVVFIHWCTRTSAMSAFLTSFSPCCEPIQGHIYRVNWTEAHLNCLNSYIQGLYLFYFILQTAFIENFGLMFGFELMFSYIMVISVEYGFGNKISN